MKVILPYFHAMTKSGGYRGMISSNPAGTYLTLGDKGRCPEGEGYRCTIELNMPGHVRVILSRVPIGSP